MPFFPCAHAGHSQWQYATKQVLVQLNAQISMQKLDPAPSLGLVYISQAYAAHASGIFAMLSEALPQVQQWVGSSVASVLGGDMDYGETGALAVLLPCVSAEDFHVFSGQSLPSVASGLLEAGLTLVHGEACHLNHARHLPALRALQQTSKLMGGLSEQQVQVARAPHLPSHMPASIGGAGVRQGGIAGVVFGAQIPVLGVSMQGCKAVGSSLQATKVDGDTVLELDGQPALDVLVQRLELGRALVSPNPDVESIWRKVQQTQLAIAPQAASSDGQCIAPQACVQSIAGLDPVRRAIVLNSSVPQGHVVMLCERDEQAARADIRRACSEICEALMPEVVWGDSTDASPAQGYCISGAIYVRSQYRNTAPKDVQVDAELQLIRHALGPVPLLGFTSAFELEGESLQRLSAQLIVFLQPLQAL